MPTHWVADCIVDAIPSRSNTKSRVTCSADAWRHWTCKRSVVLSVDSKYLRCTYHMLWGGGAFYCVTTGKSRCRAWRSGLNLPILKSSSKALHRAAPRQIASWRQCKFTLTQTVWADVQLAGTVDRYYPLHGLACWWFISVFYICTLPIFWKVFVSFLLFLLCPAQGGGH